MSTITVEDVKEKIISAFVDILKETIRNITKNSYVDLSYYDHAPSAKEDDGLYNFGDIDLKDETAQGMYDFGDLSEGVDPTNIANGDYDFDVMSNPEEDTKNTPTVIVHYYYDEQRTKVFIEYSISSSFRNYGVSLEQYARYINNAINEEFKLYTVIDRDNECFIGCFPEILLLEDDKTEICDTEYVLSPYTIGYWGSLLGKYQYIEDRSKVHADFMQYMPPSAPSHKFEDFIDTVKNIQSEYNQASLTASQKNSYITEYMEIATKYKSGEYAEKIAKLNEKYNIKVGLNTKIPEAFGKYKSAYKSYFNRDLGDISSNTNYLYCYFRNFDTTF